MVWLIIDSEAEILYKVVSNVPAKPVTKNYVMLDKPRGAAPRGWPASSPLCCFFVARRRERESSGSMDPSQAVSEKMYLDLRMVSYSFLCFSLVRIVVCFFFLGAEGEKNNLWRELISCSFLHL